MSVETRLAVSLFAAETGQAASLQVGSAAHGVMLLHRKILEKLTAPKPFSSRCQGSLRQRVEQTTGDWADTKDGVAIWFPVFAWIISSWVRFWLGSERGDAGEACDAASIGGSPPGSRLLVDAHRIPLAVQFG